MACNVIKKDTSAQVSSCDFYKVFKSTYFAEHLQTVGSPICKENVKITKISLRLYLNYLQSHAFWSDKSIDVIQQTFAPMEN